jgi:hypothetical protein
MVERIWITTQRPGEEPTRIEVVCVAVLRGGRLLRPHELTWPDWSRLSAFDSYADSASRTSARCLSAGSCDDHGGAVGIQDGSAPARGQLDTYGGANNQRKISSVRQDGEGRSAMPDRG